MKNISIVITILFILISCETVISTDLQKEDPKFAITSILNPDSTFSAYVYASSFILDDIHDKPIENATITIKKISDSKTFDLEYSHELEKYVSLEKPELGEEYELSVVGEGFETATSKITLPNKDVSISNLTHQIKQDEYGWDIYDLAFNLHDSPEKNYYEIQIISKYEAYINDNLVYEETRKGYIDYDDRSILFDEYAYEDIIDDKLFNNQTQNISFSFHTHSPFDCDDENGNKLPNCYVIETQILNLREVNAAYFKFYQTVGLISITFDDPLAEPVNVYSNIENGFGLFAGFKNNYSQISKVTTYFD